MKCYIYPYAKSYSEKGNPYIRDFVHNFRKEGCEIVNFENSGNPLFPMLGYFFKTDVFIFHWLENVPLYKHGHFQYLYAVLSLLLLKIFGKEIIWFQHNKKPHGDSNLIQNVESRHLVFLLKKHATYIFTHSNEGLDLLKKFRKKADFLMHPTKNYLQVTNKNVQYDILIWGSISKYKGVYEFLINHKIDKKLNRLKVLIIGRCEDEVLLGKIERTVSNNVKFENRHISLNELKSLYSKVNYVLVPYKSETVLSSAILMDSLSLGFSVIGPNTAAFRELSNDKRINVLTYNTHKEIPKIVLAKNSYNDYQSFLNQYNWSNSTKQILSKIEIGS